MINGNYRIRRLKKKFIGMRLYTQPQHVKFTVSKLYSFDTTTRTVYDSETVKFAPPKLSSLGAVH